METALGILGLAAGVGALVPLLNEQKDRRSMIVAFALTLLLAGGVWLIWHKAHRDAEIEAAEQDVLSRLDEEKPFDQLYDELYYRDYNTASEALDNLVAAHRVRNRKVTVTTSDGQQFTIRTFKRSEEQNRAPGNAGP